MVDGVHPALAPFLAPFAPKKQPRPMPRSLADALADFNVKATCSCPEIIGMAHAAHRYRDNLSPAQLDSLFEYLGDEVRALNDAFAAIDRARTAAKTGGTP